MVMRRCVVTLPIRISRTLGRLSAAEFAMLRSRKEAAGGGQLIKSIPSPVDCRFCPIRAWVSATGHAVGGSSSVRSVAAELTRFAKANARRKRAELQNALRG